jgi:DNA-binding transcriptional LysR family regulator
MMTVSSSQGPAAMLDDTIRYAMAVARYGSFTAASAQIGISQSAITKRVAELEHRLGYAIFRRTSRGIILTDEGLAFVNRATRLLEDLDALMLRNRDPYGCRLRVGVSPAALDGLIVKPIIELQRRYPQVQLDVSSANAELMMHQLRNGRVDVVLGLERLFREQADLEIVPLVALDAVFFARKGHPLEHQKRVPSSVLANFDFVLPSGIPPYIDKICAMFEGANAPAAGRLHAVDHFPLVRALICQSDAIGVVSASYIGSNSFSAEFALIDAIEAPPPGELSCAIRAGWEATPVVKAFLRTCEQTFRPEQARRALHAMMI